MEPALLTMKEFQLITHRSLIDFSDEILRIWNIIWSEYSLSPTDPSSGETRMLWYAITQTLILIKEYYYGGHSELGLPIETSFPFKVTKKFHELTKQEQISVKCWCDSLSPWTKLDSSTSSDPLHGIKAMILANNNTHEWSDLGKRMGLVSLLYYIEELYRNNEATSAKLSVTEEMKVIIMCWLRDPNILINPMARHLPIYILSDWIEPINKLVNKDDTVKPDQLKFLIENRLFKLSGSYRDKLLAQYTTIFPFLGLKDEVEKASHRSSINLQYMLNLPIINATFSPAFLSKRLSQFFTQTDVSIKQSYDDNKRYWEAWAKLFASEVINPHCLLNHEDIYSYPFGEILGLIHENKACLFTRHDLIWIMINKNNPWTKVDFNIEHLTQIETFLKSMSSCRDTIILTDIYKKLKPKTTETVETVETGPV